MKMADIYDIQDLYLLRRFAESNGHTLPDLLSYLEFLKIDVNIATKLIEKGIKFEDYIQDSSLIEEDLPEGVVSIFELYRKREEDFARREKHVEGLEKKVEERVEIHERNSRRIWSYGLMAVAAGVLLFLSPVQKNEFNPYDGITPTFVYANKVCKDLDHQLVCSDIAPYGDGFESFWNAKMGKKI